MMLAQRTVYAVAVFLASANAAFASDTTYVTKEAQICSLASRFNVSLNTCIQQINLKDDIKHVWASGGSLRFYFPASTAESCRLAVAVALMSWEEWTDTKPSGISVSCRGYHVLAKFRDRLSMKPSYFIERDSFGRTVYKFYDYSGEGR
jgi:hypothetical protein